MTLDLQAIAAWNVRQRAARAEYAAHPIAACRRPGCANLTPVYYCLSCTRSNNSAAKRMQRARDAA
jgi:hypothetical protein